MNGILDPEVPLVSAIMIVGRMPQWAVQLAVNCFANQTHPNRELIIINNCKTQYEASQLNLKLPQDKSGRPLAVVIDTETLLSAGMCRNYALSAANGDVLIQFDAHCWHAPTRIQEQLFALLKHQAHICMLQRCLEYSYNSGYAGAWTNSKNCILNSMIFLRPQANDYMDTDKLEELSLVNKMIQSGYKPITIDRPGLIMRAHYGTGEPVRKPISLAGRFGLDKEGLKLVRGIVKTTAIGHSDKI